MTGGAESGRAMRIELCAAAEDGPGERFRELYARHADAYRLWYSSPGERPTYLECERALRRHLPEWVPTWERLCDLSGGGDIDARLLSLWRPPPYVRGCSQVAIARPEPILVRNYDYAPRLWDATLLRTRWNGRTVLAMTDCLVGVLDGVNDAGLAVSLSFGGSREVGEGFGAPLLLRIALETCDTAVQATRLLRRVPTHMAYNVLVLDSRGDFFTAFTGPSGPTIVRRTAVSTNHQDRVAWPRHAWATATLERERVLHAHLADPALDPAALIEGFLGPPLRSVDYERGHGTLYTAAYRPGSGALDLRWPGARWEQSIAAFEEGVREIELAG